MSAISVGKGMHVSYTFAFLALAYSTPYWEQCYINSPLLDQGEVATEKYNTGDTRYRGEGRRLSLPQ